MKTTRRSVLRGALAGTAVIALTGNVESAEATGRFRLDDPVGDARFVPGPVWYHISGSDAGKAGIGKMVYDSGWVLVR